MAVNYNDKRFTTVEKEEKKALNEIDVTYGNMISQSDAFFEEQKNAAQDYADEQTEIQNQKTDFAIEQIEQQKDKAQKDYIKEQSGAYVDWQKQSNPYGVKAEQMAASGMQNTGYSESVEASIYNTYQNRMATARESYNQAVLNYDNAIKDARIQNSSILAEIAYNTLQKQLEISLQGFQYKNQLILEKANKEIEVKNIYYNRYQDVLKQINTENALAEEKRQFDFANGITVGNKSSKKEKNSGKGYNNGNVSKKNIKKMQKALGITADGMWGSNSTSVSGGLSADEAWKAYQNGTLGNNIKIKGTSAGFNGKLSSTNILDLGYGPISASEASRLVDEGKLTYKTDKNGNVTFTKVIKPATLPTSRVRR